MLSADYCASLEIIQFGCQGRVFEQIILIKENWSATNEYTKKECLNEQFEPKRLGQMQMTFTKNIFLVNI